jgi:AraC-like DNA-binding protein
MTPPILPLTSLETRPVSPDLRPFVTAFVERRDSVALSGMHELPTPAPLIQVMLGGDFRLVRTGEAAPRAGLWGPSSTAPRSRAEGPLHVFVAVLTLRGAALAGRGVQGGLANRRLPLDEILSVTQRLPLARIAEQPHIDRRVAVMEAWLRRLVAEVSSPVDPTLAVIDAAMRRRLRVPVADLARRLGVSERGLHKRCHRLIGLPPKRLLRIARLQRLLRTLHPSPWLRGADGEDARLEYADDSHLARDFADLTGLTPSAYRAAKLASGDRLLHTLI